MQKTQKTFFEKKYNPEFGFNIDNIIFLTFFVEIKILKLKKNTSEFTIYLKKWVLLISSYLMSKKSIST